MSNDRHVLNQQVIKEFRANKGKVGGNWAGDTLILLHTVGAKSGQIRTIPLVCVKDGEHFVIAASKGGAPTHPDWYHNIQKNPEVTVEMGEETFRAKATCFTEGPERDRLYAKLAEHKGTFAGYEKKTTRKIPAVTLTRMK